jgi:hypothetical protein
MADIPTLSIPPLTVFHTLPLFRSGLYYLLLGAIADRATELRFEVGDEEFGKVWLKVPGKEYAMVPCQNKEIQRLLYSLVKPMRRWISWFRKGPTIIPFYVDINGKVTAVQALIRPDEVLLRFLDPEKASDEAQKISISS